MDGKRVSKFNFEDLLLLFPLYEVNRIEMLEELGSGIYIEQKAIGFIGSFELNVDNYNPEDLQFILLEMKNKYLLQKVTYQNQNFKFRIKETAINYQNSFEEK